MRFPPHFPVAFLLQAALFLAASAQRNYTVDDQDPLFQYFGSWGRVTTNLNSTGGNMDEDGGHMLTSNPGSYATITYTFASVYFLATLWPYPVSTDYQVDGNPPVYADMQDHSVPPTGGGGNATVASNVVASWIGNVDQQHTIYVTIPPGGQFAVVDMFIFEVLNPSDAPSTALSSTSPVAIFTSFTTISPTLQTSSSTGTTSGTASSSSSSSSGNPGSTSSLSRDLAISMGAVGGVLALLLIFLLWWFCIRAKGKKGKNGRETDTIMPQYHSVPTIPGNGTNIPLNNDNSMSDGATGHYRLSSHINNLYAPPVALNYDRVSSSYSGRPSTVYTNHSESSSPSTQPINHDPQRRFSSLLASDTQPINHNPQGRISSLLLATDRPPVYCLNPTDESAPVSSSSSSNGNTNEKNRRSRILMADPDVGFTTTTTPGRGEDNVSARDTKHPKPL